MITPDEFIACESGALSPDEKARFEDAIASDAQALREWVAHRQMDEALRVVLGDGRNREAVLRSIVALVEGPDRDQVKAKTLRVLAPPRWGAAKILAGLGAAAAVMLALWLASVSREKIAVLTAMEDHATIERAGRTMTVHRSLDLKIGDILSVAAHPGAMAGVKYPDATELSFGPGSRCAIEAGDDGRKAVRLMIGTLQARVTKQPAGRPLTIATPHANVTVIGTEFSLDVESAGTRLDVQKGIVRMARADDRDAVEISAGQSAVFMPGTKLPVARQGAGGEPEKRRSFMWPFAAESPWNQPLGTDARYEPIQSPGFDPLAPPGNVILGRPVFDEVVLFPSRRVLVNGLPVLNVRFADKWGPGFAAAWPIIVIIDPVRMAVAELRGADRLASGDLAAQEVRRGRLDGSGVAPEFVGLADCGVSALGGLIRHSELTRGIRHVLAVSVRKGALNRLGPDGESFVWPASGALGAEGFGESGNLFMGSRLALPASLDLARLGVGDSGPAYELARALQDYGAYITETGDQPFALLAWYENIPPDFARHVAALLPHLQVVINNTPAISGAPRRPPAPPFEP